MANGDDFRLGEGGQETMKNFIAALIGDFVEQGRRPDECAVLADTEAMIGSLPAVHRAAIVMMVRGLEVSPLAMGYRHQFSNLSRDEQVKVLDSFEKSSNYLQRGMIMVLKNFVLVSYFSTKEMEEALGYDHDCLVGGPAH